MYILLNYFMYILYLFILQGIHTCLNVFLGGPRDPHDPRPSRHLGVAGVVGAAWFYDKRSNARALLHDPLTAPLLRVQLVVAVAAYLPPRPRRVQLELLLRQLPPAISAFHHINTTCFLFTTTLTTLTTKTTFLSEK